MRIGETCCKITLETDKGIVTLTKDTKAGDFVIGRAYEICKENKAFEYLIICQILC